jgi:RNA polymerase sigma factor (sigma-70 family)
VHEDQPLLQSLAAGQRTATEEVYRRHYPTVLHWLLKAGGSDNDAADIFQEAMVVLYQKAQSAEFRLSCRIGTYLFAIAKHLWYKRLDQKSRGPLRLPETAGGDDAPDWHYEDDVKAHEERELHYEQLAAALDTIGEPCRALLKAFYNEGQSMQEIAAGFGYTNPDNAKTQKYKCLSRLRKIFFGTTAR